MNEPDQNYFPEPIPETAMTEAERLRHLNDLAWTLRTGDPQQSKTLAVKAVQLANTLGNPAELAQALLTGGSSLQALGEYDDALVYFSESLKIYEALEDGRGQTLCLNLQGETYLTRGFLAEALDSFEQCLPLCRAIGETQLECTVLENIGNVYNNLDNHYMARQFYDQVLQRDPDAERLCSVTLSLGCVHLLIAIKHAKSGERETAETEYRQAELRVTEALTMTRQSEDRTLESICLCNLANVRLGLDETERAIELVENALEIAQQVGAQRLIGCYLVVRGEIQLRRNELPPAIASLEAGLTMLQERNLKLNIAETHQLLSEAYETQGDFSTALAHYKQFHRIEGEVRNEIAEQRTRTIAMRFEVEKSQQQAELERLRAIELSESNHKLQRQSEFLERLSREDGLTGLTNRRSLDERLAEYYAISRVEHRSLTVALMDIDHFKSVNDRFSHQMGDQVLQRVGEILGTCCRESDIAARYGGEEFALVLPNLTLEQSLIVCERVRQTVQNYDWSTLHLDLRVTLSIGLATLTPLLDSPEALIHRADEHLYEAKQNGRNQVRCVLKAA